MKMYYYMNFGNNTSTSPILVHAHTSHTSTSPLPPFFPTSLFPSLPLSPWSFEDRDLVSGLVGG